MECRDVQEDDSDILVMCERSVCVGVMPSLSDGLESLEDTLTESMLSPELPAGGDLAVSLTGELVAVLVVESVPKKSRLSLFTILVRDLGDVGLLSPSPSISQDRP